MNIGFVCTNFNNNDYSVAAVQSLPIETGVEYTCVIIDNASDESHRQTLRDFESSRRDCHVIYNKTNVGYFAGLNTGLRFLNARLTELDWIVIGNNDLTFDASLISGLSEFADVYAQYMVVSPDIVTLDGQHQNPHVISSISRGREKLYDLYHLNYYLGAVLHWLAAHLPKTFARGDEDHWSEAREIWQGHGLLTS